MAIAFAWLDGEQATENEKADALDLKEWWDNPEARDTEPPVRRTNSGTIHVAGEHKGQIYVTTGPVRIPDTEDFKRDYMAALAALLAQDERVGNGHAFSIGII